MCGIYLTNIPFDNEEITSKLNSISFRGPDYTGIEKVNDLTFGHLRLSILDLDPRSNQPMFFKNLTIVFNGEIYNYISIREELTALGYKFKTESDTEVLLIGYKHWGKSILDKINGMFAFSIYDSKTNILFSARDRLGVKPFYYYWENGKIEICSQIKPMLSGKKVNDDAISMFLDCMFIPSPYTIAKNIYKLPPGNYMEIDFNNNSLQTFSYWNLKPVKIKDISYEDAKHELHKLLLDAVKIRLQSDVPIGSFLSGGIDSALVSSIAAKVSKSKINTFSIGFDDPKYDESKIAEQYAKILNTTHTTTICNASDILHLIPKLTDVYDEPFADSSALPSLLLNKVTKQYVTVALSGDGGDESFIGYEHFDSLVRNKRIMDIPYILRKFIANSGLLKLFGMDSYRIKNALYTKSRNDFIENIFSRKGFLLNEKKQEYMKHYQGYKSWSDIFLQKAADLNIKLWLENDSNVKVDRASMAYSVEVRSPFLDYRVIEFARSLPMHFKYEKGRQKKILRDILKEYIPESVFDQPKRGFAVPIGEWMRKELKEEFLEALNDDFLNSVPNLNVKKFKNLLIDHMEGNEDHTANVWKLYVLSKWYKEFGFGSN
ncbi:asparagine synthase (glutamine-hydrolyzing) [Winogradskyella sediminis]|uniref:asparagine synthase (glutamine-hydrolyzing) n=1 Tax=Winogradskyella sediminis TaxID=1382466 RepID=A0A1H1LPV0_9FLAO|nr:asparagine synthase (glutamine-hydrolyzing) [Winogradskyella sediminis]REG86124.1 asparagine synthase (glutamine-hydrolysing) [Winogradskyella sediminis]SDR76526.1 asparagine synthase (glutamine-hydrolysing) [Winogradskyella sediminis]